MSKSTVKVGGKTFELTDHAISRFFEGMKGSSEGVLWERLRKSLKNGEKASPLLVAMLCGRVNVDEKSQYRIDPKYRGIWVINGGRVVTMLRLSGTQVAILKGKDTALDRRVKNKGTDLKKTGKAVQINRGPFHDGAGTTKHLGPARVKVLVRKIKTEKGWILSDRALKVLKGMSGLDEEEILDQFGDTLLSLPVYGVGHIFAFRVEQHVFIGQKKKGWGHVEVLPDISEWKSLGQNP